VKLLREEHSNRTANWSEDDLVFIDECGINIGMRQLYAWGPKGERVVGTKSVHRGENLTVVGALTNRGLLAVTPWPGTMNTEGFEGWVEAALLPHLRPGHIVVMDNLIVHRAPAVRRLLNDAGVTLAFLPPYSPDLNPIEECWAKIKHWVRKFAARGLDQLLDALARSCAMVTPQDAMGWFRHALRTKST
jgi:transposase